VLHAGQDIGRPADARLQLLGGVGHHLRVETEPGHHRKTGLRRVADADLPQVDRAVTAGQRDLERRRHVERHREVARQQVARPQRQDPQRYAGSVQPAADGLDRAVATGGQHHAGAVLHRLAGQPLTRVLGGGLVDRRSVQPVPGAGLGHLTDEVVEVVDLRRVGHQGGHAVTGSVGRWCVRFALRSAPSSSR
jgi:hypothetical protein